MKPSLAHGGVFLVRKKPYNKNENPKGVIAVKDRLDRVESRAHALFEAMPAEVEVLIDEVEFWATLEKDGDLMSGPLGRMRVERIRPENAEPFHLIELHLAWGLVAEFLGVPENERFLVEEAFEPFMHRVYILRGEENPFPVGWRRLLKNYREAIERVPHYGGADAAERFERAIKMVEVIARGPVTLDVVLPPNQVHDALGRYFTRAKR